MEKMLKNAIEQIMKEYSENGTVFFNEAHFQFEFAISLSAKLSMSNYRITLEHCPNFKKYRVDLLVEDIKNNEKTIIEFKYVTKKATIEIHEQFYIDLKSQGAYDIRRYQIWRDISKLEDLLDNKKCDHAYFLMITNADKLIKPVPKNNLDCEFDISTRKRNRPDKKELYWSHPSPRTERRYPNRIIIRKNESYKFDYIPYSSSTNAASFKYLILQIPEK